MLSVGKKAGLVLCSALVIAVNASGSAQAYGPEGLFGGRLQPDNTINLNPITNTDIRPDRSQSVLQHPRPDYDPVPVMFGSFDLYPSLESGVAYDSNIFAAANNAASDTVITLRPTVSALSNWNRHALQVISFGDINFHTDKSHEDFKNFVVDAQGRYDIMHQTWLLARGSYQRLTEPRFSPSDAGGSEPVSFDMYKGGVSFYRGVGLLKTAADYDLQRFNYFSVPSTGGVIDQSFRDRTEHKLSTRVSYDVTENLRPYIRGGYNWRDYESNSQRRSKGYEAVVGAMADFGGITSLDLYAGWLAQDYGNFAAKNVNSGVNFGGRLDWNVTGLTSVAVEANRSVEETTLAGFNSYMASGGSVTVTHELLRNLLLEGDFGFTRADYNGAGSRQDDTFSAGPGARWLINQNLYTDLMYNWSHRTSNVDTAGYVRHIVSVRFGVQM